MQIISTNAKTFNPKQSDYTLHIHNFCEVLCFLDGNCDYFVEGRKYHLHKGDLMIMRAAETHNTIINSNKAYERILVNFPISVINKLDVNNKIYSMFYERPLGKYNHFTSSMFPEKMWKYYLEKICKAEEQERKLIYLYALLDELTDDFEIVKTVPEDICIDKIYEIIQYIDRHLFENISLDIICNRFFISKTHLNKIFKENTNTTVWKYIIAKRLTYAKELLQNGENPTKIYEQCGFNDYVSFYKAYKNYYKVAPITNKSKVITTK